MSSWYDTVEHTKKICDYKIDPPVDPKPVLCVDPNYSDPEGGCDPGTALACVANLERAVFDPSVTEDGFCS